VEQERSFRFLVFDGYSFLF